jgi:hypothetical protein
MLIKVQANELGLRYGIETLEQGGFGNDLFAFEAAYFSAGYIFDFRNLTEYPIVLNWERCLLVDHEGWTHNITDPDVGVLRKEGPYSEVIIAPVAKRRVAFVARGTLEQQLNRPGRSRAFHPPRATIGAKGFTERVILDLTYRGKHLTYDLTVRLRPSTSR